MPSGISGTRMPFTLRRFFNGQTVKRGIMNKIKTVVIRAAIGITSFIFGVLLLSL